MMALLAELVPWGRQALMTGIVVFLRVGAVMAIMPAFGEQSVPTRVKLGLAIAFTLIVAPAVAGSLPGGDLSGLVFATEVTAGLALGFALRLMVMILQIAGTVAAQATSLSQILGGAGADPQPAMGQVMITAGLALAVTMGLHVKAAQAIILSYQVLPPGQFPDVGMLADWGVARVGWAFALAVTLAMPFVIASLIYNLALGVINRAMPQLMVAMVGAPAITAGGLVLLALALPIILDIWGQALDATLAAPFEAPR